MSKTHEFIPVEGLDTSTHSNKSKWQWMARIKMKLKTGRSHFAFARNGRLDSSKSDSPTGDQNLAKNKSRQRRSLSKTILRRFHRNDRENELIKSPNFGKKISNSLSQSNRVVGEFSKSNTLSHKFHPMDYSSTESLEYGNHYSEVDDDGNTVSLKNILNL